MKIRLGLFLLLFFAFGTFLIADPSAVITGVISDPSGGPVPGAQISIVNVATGVERLLETNARGIYTSPPLDPGIYRMTVKKAGFKSTVKDGIELHVQDSVAVNLTIAVGVVSESVTVDASAVQIETNTADIGTVVNVRQVEDLPLNGRNFLQLAYLVPGASSAVKTQVTGRGAGPNDLGLQISGGQATNNSFQVDGIESSGFRFSNQGLKPILDAVEEFRVQTSPYDTQYGFLSSAQINVATKAGTNQIHGDVWEFVRNTDFNTRNFFDVKKAPFQQNQFGFTTGGPVKRNNTFFFVAGEWLRTRQGASNTAQVPTAAQRTGDFSASTTPVIDPLSNAPFPGNIIPSARINAISAVMVALYPQPNIPGGTPNFVNPQKNLLNEMSWNGRVDHQFSTKWNLFARYSFQKEDGVTAAALPNFGIPIGSTVQNVALVNTYTISPTLLTEFRVGFNRQAAFDSSQQIGQFAGTSILNIQGIFKLPLPLDGYPSMAITGLTTLGDLAQAPETRAENNEQIVFNISKLTGSHLLKVGVDIRPLQMNDISVEAFNRGSFTFTNFLTHFTNALPDFLLGEPATAVRTTSTIPGSLGIPRADARSVFLGGYVSDQYKVGRRLTLNMGIRWELQQPFVDKQNRESIFVPDGVNTTAKNGTFILSGDANNGLTGRQNRSLYPYDLRDWCPRLGFAWDPTGRAKTVIRGGYGMYFTTAEWNAVFLAWNAPPYRIDQTFTANAATGALLNLSSPFPSSQSGGTIGGRNLSPDYKNGYVQQWSFGAQQQLPGSMMADLTYLGSKGTNLTNLEWVNTGALPGTAVAPYFRPYPQYGTFLTTFAHGDSRYNALQAVLRKQIRSGFAFLASYTYGHSLDDTPGPAASTEQFEPQNRYNLAAEKASSDFDQRQHLTISANYDLPFGPGRHFNTSKAAGYLVGGWQMQGILTAATGTPWTAVVSGNQSLTSGSTDRPNRICDGNIPSDQRTRLHWFNTTCFPLQPLGYYGTSGRNIIAGPGQKNLDFSIIKKFTIKERLDSEFRAEAFNICNWVNFSTLSVTANSSTFGVLTAAAPSRILQFGFKLRF
jgi:hypothetical protein